MEITHITKQGVLTNCDCMSALCDLQDESVDLRRGRVVQSRGRFNKLTDRHDDIVNLCNNNAKTILAARQP